VSECCSVVAMNRPGDVVPGTVGRPLDPVRVSIEDGEIVVEGATVMDGYLNGDLAPARWRTGDRGRFRDGRLVVEGRRDALLVLPNGRNVAPEWIEARIDADPRVVGSVLCLTPGHRSLRLLVASRVPVPARDIAGLCADLPAYARPGRVAFVDARTPGLFLASGAPDRAVARRLAAIVPAEALHHEAVETEATAP
jgi:acyl-CoA synthetase (AMP-forming)/AMP-acid ligase II